MYKIITPSNEIFDGEEFQKDKYKFNLILKNLPSPELELYSDEKSYMVCRGSKKWPTWIWTKDNFDVSKIKEIEELINYYLLDSECNKFTCKKELYDMLVKNKFENINKDSYFEMGFLICNKTKKPKVCDGILSKPDENEIEILAKYWYDDNMEMNGIEPITMEQAKKDAKEFVENDKFYVLRNSDGKIVCMAGYTIAEEQAKINHVYTPPDERGKGYAANLIYAMTNYILEKGLVPLLYTDYKYIPSNKAYINAGYEDKGILINFSCSPITKKVRSAGDNFNFKSYFLNYNNISDLEGSDEIIEIFKNIELMSAKNEYENNLHNSLSYNKEKDYYYRFDGFDVDILNTSFNDIDGLKHLLDITYKCDIDKNKIKKIEISNNTEIFTKVFFYTDFIDENEKDDIKLEIDKLTRKMGDFVDLYEIDDDEINNFYINMGVYCIVFEKYTVVVMFGSNE